jgi:hypothetical protein
MSARRTPRKAENGRIATPWTSPRIAPAGAFGEGRSLGEVNPGRLEIALRSWTRLQDLVDSHADTCRDCLKRTRPGRPPEPCRRANRLMRSEQRARQAYQDAGGTLPAPRGFLD